MSSKNRYPDLLIPEDIFQCQMCGACCQGYGGTFVTDEQIRRIADYIGMDVDQFVREKCQFSSGRPLLAQNGNGACIFWDKLCTIYPVRPDMCRKWPFIEGILRDVTNWHIMAGSCPGMRTDFPDNAILDCVKKALSEMQLA